MEDGVGSFSDGIEFAAGGIGNTEGGVKDSGRGIGDGLGESARKGFGENVREEVGGSVGEGVVRGIGGYVAENTGDGVGNNAEVVVEVVVVSKTAAKSVYKLDVSDVIQIPFVHPPRMIEPSVRTATSLKSSLDMLPA